MSNPPISDLTEGLELSESEIEQKLGELKIEPMQYHLQSIVENAQLKFRDNVEAEAPEDAPGLVYGDSESDEELPTPQERSANRFMFVNAEPVSLGKTIIGGAVVKNLALVVPDESASTFGDLPVFPITATGQDTTELVAVISKDTEAGGFRNVPLLLMPDEEGYEEEATRSAGDKVARLAAISALSNLGKIAGNEEAKAAVKEKSKGGGDDPAIEKADGEGKGDKVAKTELESYVLSGDIENFFGIKGLTGKLYKYKGPETKDKTDGNKEGSKDKEDQAPADDKNEAEPTAQGEGKNIAKAKADEDKDDGKGKDDSKGKKDKEKKEPVREKVTINTKSVSLKGKPLGTLLPFLESDEIKNLPIENLEFTYCEEKSGHFFPPGLRLEVDVLLKDSLQWATDALQKMFGEKRRPKKIHLSAELGKKRDWSKRPKVDDFALRGYFTEFGYETWDILEFKTLGLEITATKAAKNPSKEDKAGKDGKDGADKTEKKDGEKNEKQPPDDTAEETPTEPQPEVTVEQVSALQVKSDSPKSQPKPDADAKGEEGSASNKDEENPSKDKEGKVKKSYNYGFGFFGTVSFIKIPHAKAPLDLHIRIGRDFEVEKNKDKGKDGKDKGKDEKDQKEGQAEEEKNSTSENTSQGKDVIPTDSKKDTGAEKTDAGAEKAVEKAKEAEKKPKEYSDGRHKRMWRVVIYCDEWKDVYGVKNVTMKKAELKWSFEQGNFKETMAFDFTADAKLGAGTVKVKGKFSRDDNFIDGEVGDLSLTDIKKIHAQIQGHEVPEEKKKDEKEKTAKEKEEEKKKKQEEKKDEEEEAKGNEVTFKKIHLKLSSKFIKKQKTTKRSLTLEGHVTFNGEASAQALLEINNDGLTISGGLADYKIPGTVVTIEDAQLLIFIGFKQKKKSEKDGKKPITDAPSAGKESDQPDKTKTAAEAQSSKEAKSDDQGKSVLKPDGNDKKTKRESEFAILGVVKIEEVKVSVGFYTARTKGKAKRDWLAFGSVQSLVLSDLVSGIQNEDFNLCLDNVALIASSDDREIKEDEEEDEEADKKRGNEGSEDKKTNKQDGKKVEQQPEGEEKAVAKKGKEGKGGTKNKDDEDSSHAGVLKTVESYKYPIRKGVQLCATIRKFEPLEQLNNNKKIDGLILIIAFTPEGLEIKIDLPKSLQVPLHPHAILGDFGGTLYAAEGALELSTALTLLCDDQKPIRIVGKIKGSLIGASGELHMHKNDKWVNPFDVNEKVVLSRLGFGAGITYATVWAQGPDTLSFSGAIDIGRDFHADMAFSIGVKKEQLISVHVTEINLSELVRLAGEMTDIVSLQEINAGDDILVFREIKFYMSNGGVVLGVRYDPGIQVRGMMKFFGKEGEFDGKVNDDGVMIKGGIDNFNIGGLEVRSTKAGGKRATIDIEMTEDKQKILVDGMIRFHAFELSIFVDAYLQEKRLDADISIQFTEQILLHLKAKTNVSGSESLDGVVMDFEAEIRPDVIGAILEAINHAIKTIQEAAKSIEEAEKKLGEQVGDKELELKAMENQLRHLENEVEKAVQDRQRKIEEDNQERQRLEQELEQLEKAVNDAQTEKNQNETKIQELKNKQESTQRRFDDKVRDKENEYKQKEEEERNKRKHWESERKRLEDEKESSFGDALRSAEEADRSWKWWMDEETNQNDWLKSLKDKLLWAKWWEVPGLAAEIAWAEGILGTIRARKAIDAEARHAARAFLSTPEWRNIERGINEATEQIDKIGKVIDHVLENDYYEAIKTLNRDRKTELNREIATMRELEEMSRNIEAKLKLARQALKENGGRITDKEKKLQGEVEKLQGELEKRPFENAYKAKLQDHESVKAQIEIIQKKLKEIREGTEEAAKEARAFLHLLEQAIPTVKRIVVIGSTDIFANNKPLIFKIEARWNGKPVYAEAQWAPGWSVTDLYDDIGLKVIRATGAQA